jgi:uncharacterized protein YkwD
MISFLKSSLIFFLVMSLTLTALVLSAWAVQPSNKLPTRDLVFEEELAALVNQKRGSLGIPILKKSPLLGRVARNHSRDMSGRDFFHPTNPDGRGPKARLEESGYAWRTFGENIGCGQESPRLIFKAWLKSKSHRENMLNPFYREIGIGFAAGGSCGSYWTGLFASPAVW